MHENSFQIGRAAEAAAADFLVSSGYRILARNLAWRGGEIDLVAWREGVLVFV
ncbi:MAG: YraN family protein, partial [Bdellovibrionales bacterium]|nr:YraN family protein [Bdellovibrionales bacterium]